MSNVRLHLIRVDLETTAVDMVEICGGPASWRTQQSSTNAEHRPRFGNGVVTAFDATTMEPL